VHNLIKKFVCLQLKSKTNFNYYKSMKSKLLAYLLWFFLGVFGVHKFYLHKWLWGVLYFFTGGFACIGWLIDLFTLGTQVDAYNLATFNKKLIENNIK